MPRVRVAAVAWAVAGMLVWFSSHDGRARLLAKCESERRPESGIFLRPFSVILALTSCSPFLSVLELWREAALLVLTSVIVFDSKNCSELGSKYGAVGRLLRK